jgi:nucleotide-binding universal stress UspA family protein
MYRSILVPLDGSLLGEQALPTAIALCKHTVARLHIVHVRRMTGVVESPSTGEQWSDDGARAYLDSVCDRVADELGESVSFAILPPEEPQLLLASPSAQAVAQHLNTYALANRIDLVVMTTHGRGGVSRAWFGSVTEALLRNTDIPLLLIRPEERADDGFGAPAAVRHILVALDGSRDAEQVLGPARELGEASNARFTLLRVIPKPVPMFEAAVVAGTSTDEDTERLRQQAERDLARAAESLRESHANVTTAAVFGETPAKAILRYARDHDVDAIALTTHGRHALSRMVLGSVADKVIRGAECPALVVRRSTADVDERTYAANNPARKVRARGSAATK